MTLGRAGGFRLFLVYPYSIERTKLFFSSDAPLRSGEANVK